MPRPSPQYHPLQDIRTVLGTATGRTRPVTQDQLGAMLPEDGQPRAGITIRRIEAGSLPLSTKLAAQITALTGVDTRPMLKGKLRKPKTLAGRAFTFDTLREWQDKQLANVEIGMLAEALSTVVRKRLEAAQDTEGVCHAFCQMSAALGSVDGEPLPGIGELAEAMTVNRNSFESLFEIAQEKPPEKKAQVRKRSAAR